MHIVLVEPQIPPNTGNISRLCAGTNTHLHLVRPLGFSLEDRYLKRAGLDYWPHVKLHIHDSLGEILERAPVEDLAFYSTHAQNPYTSFEPQGEAWMVFGCETRGLGPELIERFKSQLYRIPISDKVRSLNLSNAAAIVLYDQLHKRGFPIT